MGERVRTTTANFVALFAVTGSVLLFSACNKEEEEIKVYRVVKAPLENPVPASMPPPSSMALPPDHPPVGGASATSATAPPVSGSSAATSNAPAPPHWESQPLAQMRKASFLVRGENGAVADISLITLGPMSDVLGNVNRWLGQIGQPSVTAEQLAEITHPLPGDANVTVVDIEGKPEQGDPNKDGRIIAAIAPGEGGTAFFKMRGNIALVGAEKENFLNWVRTSRSGPK